MCIQKQDCMNTHYQKHIDLTACLIFELVVVLCSETSSSCQICHDPTFSYLNPNLHFWKLGSSFLCESKECLNSWNFWNVVRTMWPFTKQNCVLGSPWDAQHNGSDWQLSSEWLNPWDKSTLFNYQWKHTRMLK